MPLEKMGVYMAKGLIDMLIDSVFDEQRVGRQIRKNPDK